MKNSRKEKMLLSMDLVDEKYVSEANPANAKRYRRKLSEILRTKKFVTIAASIAIVFTALNVALFTPFRNTPPDVSMYADSEYYSIIEKLNIATTPKPDYKNLADLLTTNLNFIVSDFFSDILFGERKDEASVTTYGGLNDGSNGKPLTDGSTSGTYQETTDNQVAGVIEADRIKRSDKYIYYLDSYILRVFSIEGNDSREVGSYNLPVSNYYDQCEFYLSEDCQTITLIRPSYTYISHDSDQKQSVVNVISLDVSDPAEIQKIANFTITGGYLSSRMVDGELILFTQFSVGYNLDFSNEASFLPQINSGEGYHSLPLDAIISPETLTQPRYTVVSKLSEDGLVLSDCAAFLSYSENVYVSAENIFATRTYTDTKDSPIATTETTMTEITGIAYSGNEFTTLGSVSVAGEVKNQYSLDEYEGILRVVTTTRVNRLNPITDSVTSDSKINASLYCINLDNWSVRAKVENFAPDGETAESVRFDGTAAYVCTAEVVQLTDPVYFFDLSDLDHITYKDTGTIEGYSTSLVNFGDGYLLGIGVGSTPSSPKIEIYEETADGVQSVCAYELNRASYSNDYKSYYIDRENHMVGIGINDFTRDMNQNQVSRYLLLFFDGYDLHAIVDEPLNGQNQVKRGLLIDGYFYLFGTDDFKVIDLQLNDQ